MAEEVTKADLLNKILEIENMLRSLTQASPSPDDFERRIAGWQRADDLTLISARLDRIERHLGLSE